jgi:uridylate kinase
MVGFPLVRACSNCPIKRFEARCDGILDWRYHQRVCAELLSGLARGPVAVVVYGGNIMRGAEMRGRNAGDPTRGDYMGMLATSINSLALKEGIERQSADTAKWLPRTIIPNVCHQ